MVALSHCLSSLALFVGTSSGARRHKRWQHTADTKFIAGVPVLNVHVADSLDEEWVVMMKPDVTDAQITELCGVATYGCRLTGNPSKGGVPFLEMRGTEQDLEAVIQSGHGAVRYVEHDSKVYAIPDIPELQADDNDSVFMWGLERVGANKRANEGAGVTIFLSDTGVRGTHQEFGGRVIPTLETYDGFLRECNDDTGCAGDKNGHGSHCAGTAAGANFGVAPAATIRSVKVLNDRSEGSWGGCYAALDWMATSDIRPAVASFSFGGPGNPQGMVDAIGAATSAGVTVVVAGGNDNNDSCMYSPAFVPSAITVGSTDSRDRKSPFSNYGSCTNIWAPGSGIRSCGIGSDKQRNIKSGTSMACPHVAGGAALILERNPTYMSGQVLGTLLANARPDSIVQLLTGDTNKCLYVGSDAPPPASAPFPPVSCPEATTTGRLYNGRDCKCIVPLKCYRDGEQGCPINWASGNSTRWYDAELCSTCVCKAVDR